MKAQAQTMQVADGNYVFYRMGGGRITTIGSAPKSAVIVMPNQKLDTWYRSLLRNDALVVVIKEPKVSEPPVEAPPADDGAPELVPEA